MRFSDWVSENQAKEGTQTVRVHLLKQEPVFGDHEDKPPKNLVIEGDNLLALKALMLSPTQEEMS